MKTIEERAKEYAPGISNSDSLFPTRISTLAAIERRGYIAGATEQKAIDDAKWLKIKSSWEKEAQINHDDVANYKQGYHDAIEKACEWLGPHLAEVADLYDSRADLLLRLVKENFRIAMEKEL